MKRFIKQFESPEIDVLKSKLFQWSQQYETICFLDSNLHPDAYQTYNAVLAVGEIDSIKTVVDLKSFDLLSDFFKTKNDYLFGFLTYDLKNDVEQLSSSNFDGLFFPALYFFQPQKIIFINNNILTFSYLVDCENEIESDFNSINNIFLKNEIIETGTKPIKINQRISKNNYIQKCNNLLQHIYRGDIYEVNFCIEFFVEQTKINPFNLFKKLNEISSPPFASFFKHQHLYLCSASPERYLKKMGQKVISQPIKGTIMRGNSEEQDAEFKKILNESPKEQSENIMIVDLVRNDLSKTAVKGSVQVEELCGLYTFKQVHQLISTIKAEIPFSTNPVSILKNTFPMGSMTGAPKISAMKIIEEVEETKRGLYSGSVGYFTPQGDFDFNVVIRSILHNATTQYTSFSVGSAITSLSNPEQEYEECLLKGNAMKQVLSEL